MFDLSSCFDFNFIVPFFVHAFGHQSAVILSYQYVPVDVLLKTRTQKSIRSFFFRL